MSRILTQTLIPRTLNFSNQSPLFLLSFQHHRHTSAKGGTLIEIDLETSTEDSGSVRIVKLGDMMHNLVVQRSAPSWLPFIPGSSYWVPPKPSTKNVANLLKKCSIGGGSGLSSEERLSLTTIRGWPSSDHLLKDIVVQTKVKGIKSDESDNEEG